MDSTVISARRQPTAVGRPGTAVTVVGVMVVLFCVGFALVNVVFEATDGVAGDRYARYVAAYPVGFAVMNWLVVGLKLVGAALAVAAVTRTPRFVPPAALGVMLWAAFATLTVYVLGSIVQAVGMLTGVAGNADQIDLAGVAYVAFFLLFAAGFGVLTISYARRHHLRVRHAVLGAVGAPVVLGGLLLGVPALLASFGLLPAG